MPAHPGPLFLNMNEAHAKIVCLPHKFPHIARILGNRLWMLQERVTMIHKMVEIRLRCQASKAKPEDLIYKVEFSDRQFSSSLSITSQWMTPSQPNLKTASLNLQLKGVDLGCLHVKRKALITNRPSDKAGVIHGISYPLTWKINFNWRKLHIVQHTNCKCK